MSDWQEKRLQPFTVTTGDGVKYTPLWNSEKSVSLAQEFNIAQFNFKGLPGTLIDRGEVKGNVYDIEFIFQGADHLVHAENFRISAADNGKKTRNKLKKPWEINHPYYGILIVQPIALKYNNDEGNITRITGQVIETIKAGSIGSGVDPFDKITIDKLAVDAALFDTYIAEVPAPQIIDMQQMEANITNLDSNVSPLTKLSDDYNKFKNGLNAAHYYISKATAFPGQAIASIQAIISFPANFNDSEINRLVMLAKSFVGLYNYVIDLPKTLRKLYENNAGTVLSTMCLATVTNVTNDFNTRPAVIDAINTILDTYNTYVSNLDTMQADNGSSPTSYIPDVNALNALSALVNYTIGNLLEIAANAQQQQTYILPSDDNVIPLAYKLYGSASDDNVDRLINDNNINYREMLLIKKGREIVYYV